ncbi:hypothetical protein SAMN04487830_10243, partial [Pseudobutyrivibrio sp. OR37]|uniref:hypothetical protein n=1 Tax=Pseudobutyrivibrio sp. OR37 TaxID=1798186 RepID=UPI0008EF1742
YHTYFVGENDVLVHNNCGVEKAFNSKENEINHFVKHGGQIAKLLDKKFYSLANYIDDANYVLKNGKYAKELNGYVSFMSGDKFGFVGLDRVTGNITTFHIKTVEELAKRAPSLGIF